MTTIKDFAARLECVWLRDVEAAVQMGGTVFDIP